MTAATLDQVRRPPTTQLAPVIPGFGTLESFELMQRGARLLASGTLVPSAYRLVIEKYDRYGNVTESRENPAALSNCVVALNMAIRMNADPVMVMQNLHIIEGRPSWSSPWIIAQINNCGRFSPLRFEMKALGKRTIEHVGFEWRKEGQQGKATRHEVRTPVEIDDIQCIAWVVEKGTGERLESSPISIGLSVMEGWYTKNGSKWKTMPDQMLRYRSAAFFGRIYAPELLMGLPAADEVEDTIIDVKEQPDGRYAADVDELRSKAPQPNPASESARQKQAEGATTVESTDLPPAGQTATSAQTAAAAPSKESPKTAAPSGTDAPPAAAAQVGMEFDDQGGNPPASSNGPTYTHEDTLELAIDFASKGDYDSALDLKHSLPADMKKRIDTAIQGHKNEVAQAAKVAPEKQAPSERPRRSYSV
ncbi:hypothetical protein [Paraburkholderia terricola]|uniref:hypothetical protein n=1 Tax=Paraburkholderia terricola TaxID=169427 RepID=UPI003ECC6B96